MSAAGEDRALRRLAAPGVRLCPLPGAAGWGVFPQGDMRRRPTCRVSTEAAEAASGAVRDDGHVRAITPDGEARLRRMRAEREAFAAQHRDEAEETRKDARGINRNVRVNRHESPLARLFNPDAAAESFLTRAEFEAGERLRGDLARSTLNPRLTMDWSAPPCGKTPRGPARDPAGASDSALDARDRVLAATLAVGAPLDTLLLDALWRLRGMDEIERAENWPRRSAKLALKLSLHRLGLHYGLIAG